MYIGNCLIEAKAEINGEYKPESGTRLIADSAFANCRSLTSVNLPEGLINIGKGAFKRCEALTDISISNSVISIGEIAFSGCGSLNITVDANNSAYCDIDGVLFTKDKNTIVAYAKDIIQPEYAVPDDVTNIGNSAFAGCAELTKVTIPDSVTRIDDSAFSSCKSLTDVYYLGTKQEWNQIETGEYNSDLLSAEINCSDGVIITPPEIDWIKAAVDPEANTVMFQVKLKDSRQLSQLEQAKLYVAEYDADGRLLNVTLGEFAGMALTAIFAAKLPETDNYKIMLWDKHNIPLMDAVDDIAAIQ